MPTDEELAAAIEHLTRWEIDSRQIVVRLVPDQGAPPVEVWTADLQKPISGGALPLDVMAELKLALEADGPPPPYFLDSKRGYTEWGASGVAEFVFLVVGWELAGARKAAYATLRSTIVRLARTARSEGLYGEQNPLDHAEAEERGRWAVRSAFDLTAEDADQLVPVAAERAADSWLVRYRLEDRNFEAELVEDGGLVTIARVGWSQRE